MKLSIIIPLYNKEKYIERCLQSLLAQGMSKKDYEIIIVDDGSKDSGAIVVEKYAENDVNVNIKLIHQQNQGPSAARNNGLNCAKGDYIYFLDADDYLAENSLNILLKLCEENKLEILEFDTKELEQSAQPDLYNYSSKNSQVLSVPISDGATYITNHDFRNQAWRYIINRSFLLDTKITFLEGMRAYEDLIFTANVFLKSNRICKINLEAHRYIKVGGSIVTTKDPKKNLEFIRGIVKAVEELDGLIKNLDVLKKNHQQVLHKLKAKQHVVVYALLVRAFKYRLNPKELDLLLVQLRKLKAYPIDSKVKGIGKDNRIHKIVFLPIFNNQTCLLLGLRVMRKFTFL